MGKDGFDGVGVAIKGNDEALLLYRGFFLSRKYIEEIEPDVYKITPKGREIMREYLNEDHSFSGCVPKVHEQGPCQAIVDSGDNLVLATKCAEALVVLGYLRKESDGVYELTDSGVEKSNGIKANGYLDTRSVFRRPETRLTDEETGAAVPEAFGD